MQVCQLLVGEHQQRLMEEVLGFLLMLVVVLYLLQKIVRELLDDLDVPESPPVWGTRD
jgi:hypothetical protein